MSIIEQTSTVFASVPEMSNNQLLGREYYIKNVTVIAVFSALATVAVVLRVWARRIQNMPLALNDYLIVLALVRAPLSTAVRTHT